jgi:uncharacterized repeat protein (TIGR01451 family)
MLAAGATATLQVVVTVDAAASGTVVNTATVSYDDAFGQPFPSVTAMDTDAVTFADLSLAKSHTGGFVVGEQGTYDLTVTNNGPVQSSGVVTVTDALPAGLTYVSGSGGGFTCSASGQTVTCTRPASPALAPGGTAAVSLVVDVGPAALPSVTNTATVAMTGDPTPGNDGASDVTAVTAATIGDRLFDDANGNGTEDAGEGGITSVTVTLYAADGTTVLATTTTDSTGAYSFTGLAGGAYVVAFDRPAGKVFTTPSRFTVNLSPGATDLTVDGGLAPASSMSGTVFDDRDGDGVRDSGEPGLPGVTVNLQQGGVTRATTTTDSAGGYTFGDLPAGSYEILVVAPPGGFKLTTPANPVPVTIAVGEDRGAIDVGFLDQKPVAGADTAQVTAGVPSTINLGANDTPGDAPATWTITTAPAHGAVTCAGSTCTYTADPAYVGLDTFVYTLTDADGDTSSGNVSVTIAAAPAATPAATTSGSTATTATTAGASTAGASVTSPSSSAPAPALAVTGLGAAREAALGLSLVLLGLVLALAGVRRSAPGVPVRSGGRRRAS